MKIPNGIHPKWYSHFPNGKYYLDNGESDEEYWARKDEEARREKLKNIKVTFETPEQFRDRILREMGF